MNKWQSAGVIIVFLCMGMGKLCAQSDDLGLWVSAEVKKKIFPGLDAFLEGEFRLRDNLRAVVFCAAGRDLGLGLLQLGVRRFQLGVDELHQLFVDGIHLFLIQLHLHQLLHKAAGGYAGHAALALDSLWSGYGRRGALSCPAAGSSRQAGL